MVFWRGGKPLSVLFLFLTTPWGGMMRRFAQLGEGDFFLELLEGEKALGGPVFRYPVLFFAFFFFFAFLLLLAWERFPSTFFCFVKKKSPPHLQKAVWVSFSLFFCSAEGASSLSQWMKFTFFPFFSFFGFFRPWKMSCTLHLTPRACLWDENRHRSTQP